MKLTLVGSRWLNRDASLRMSPTESPESTVSDFVAALRNSVSFNGFVKVPADKTFFNITDRKYS